MPLTQHNDDYYAFIQQYIKVAMQELRLNRFDVHNLLFNAAVENASRLTNQTLLYLSEQLHGNDITISRLTRLHLCLSILQSIEDFELEAFLKAESDKYSRQMSFVQSFFNEVFTVGYAPILIMAIENSSFETFSLHCQDSHEYAFGPFNMLCKIMHINRFQKLDLSWNYLSSWPQSHLENFCEVIRNFKGEELDIDNNEFHLHPETFVPLLSSAIAKSSFKKLRMALNDLGSWDLRLITLFFNGIANSKISELDMGFCKIGAWNISCVKAFCKGLINITHLNLTWCTLISWNEESFTYLLSTLLNSPLIDLHIYQEEKNAWPQNRLRQMNYLALNNPAILDISGAGFYDDANHETFQLLELQRSTLEKNQRLAKVCKELQTFHYQFATEREFNKSTIIIDTQAESAITQFAEWDAGSRGHRFLSLAVTKFLTALIRVPNSAVEIDELLRLIPVDNREIKNLYFEYALHYFHHTISESPTHHRAAFFAALPFYFTPKGMEIDFSNEQQMALDAFLIRASMIPTIFENRHLTIYQRIDLLQKVISSLTDLEKTTQSSLLAIKLLNNWQTRTLARENFTMWFNTSRDNLNVATLLKILNVCLDPNNHAFLLHSEFDATLTTISKLSNAFLPTCNLQRRILLQYITIDYFMPSKEGSPNHFLFFQPENAEQVNQRYDTVFQNLQDSDLQADWRPMRSVVSVLQSNEPKSPPVFPIASTCGCGKVITVFESEAVLLVAPCVIDEKNR